MLFLFDSISIYKKNQVFYKPAFYLKKLDLYLLKTQLTYHLAMKCLIK
jgi:hypothetical protein